MDQREYNSFIKRINMSMTQIRLYLAQTHKNCFDSPTHKEKAKKINPKI